MNAIAVDNINKQLNKLCCPTSSLVFLSSTSTTLRYPRAARHASVLLGEDVGRFARHSPRTGGTSTTILSRNSKSVPHTICNEKGHIQPLSSLGTETHINRSSSKNDEVIDSSSNNGDQNPETFYRGVESSCIVVRKHATYQNTPGQRQSKPE
jgi:hypothetical protein